MTYNTPTPNADCRNYRNGDEVNRYFKDMQPNHTEMAINEMLESSYVIFKLCSESWIQKWKVSHDPSLKKKQYENI